MLSSVNALENLEEVGGIPASLQAFGFDAQPLGLLLLQQVEGDVAEHGKVLRRMACTNAALILVEGDINRPYTLQSYLQR